MNHCLAHPALASRALALVALAAFAALAVAWSARVAVATQARAVERPIHVASSGGMLWWHDPEEGVLMAMRSARGVDEPALVRPLVQAPSAMAAGVGCLWCALPDDNEGTSIYRVDGTDTLLSSRLQNPTSGDMSLLATLSPAVAALAVDSGRPLAQEAVGGRLVRVVPLAFVPLVIADSRIRWDNVRLVPWPPAHSDGRGWALAWDHASSLELAVPRAEHAGATPFSMQSVNGAAGWNPVPGAHEPLLSTDNDAGRRVASVRDGVLLTIGSFPREANASPVGFLEGPRGGIIAVGQGVAWRMDPVTGQVERVALLTAQSTDAPAPWWPLPLVGALTVAAVVALVIMRPSRAGVDPSSLPAGWVPLPMMPRAFAFLLDALPIWAMVVLLRGDVDPSAWARWPAWAGGAGDVGWGLALIGMVTLNSAVQEAATGTSVGKRLVGAGIVSVVPGTTRARPTWRQAVCRALLRGIVLVAPALVFLTLIDPSMCGLPEVMTRTAVARRKPAGATPLAD